MATINYTTEVDPGLRYTKVQWLGITQDDEGQFFECNGLVLASIHFWGDPSPGKIEVWSSNEISPSAENFTGFGADSHLGNEVFGDQAVFFGAVKPVPKEGVIDGNVAMIFVPRS